jgi:hypothetical protein
VSEATRRRLKVHPGILAWFIATVILAGLIGLSQDPGQRLPVFLGALAICAPLFAAIGAGIYGLGKANEGAQRRKAAQDRAASEAAAAAEADRRAQLRRFFLNPLRPIIVPALVLKAGEACYGQWQAETYTMHKSTHYVGGSTGASFRVARGVYLRNSGFRGAPVQTQAMASEGRGTVYITNKRLVFVGPAKTIELAFTKIASVEPYTDGMQFNIANKSPIIVRTGDDRLPLYFHRIQEGIFDALPEDALPEELRDHPSPTQPDKANADNPHLKEEVNPGRVKINVVLRGQSDQISAALTQLRDSLQREVDTRASDLSAARGGSAHNDSTVAPAAALKTVRRLMEGFSSALQALESTDMSGPSMSGRLRALTLAYGVFLESLLNAEQRITDAPLPPTFAGTRAALLAFYDRVWEQCTDWPKIIDSELHLLGTSNDRSFTLEVEVDLTSISQAIDSAVRASAPSTSTT